MNPKRHVKSATQFAQVATATATVIATVTITANELVMPETDASNSDSYSDSY